MAKTELHDRKITNKRCPWDKTQALLIHPIHQRQSEIYSLIVRKYFESLDYPWDLIKAEIRRHSYYTAQNWIDEYNKLIEAEEQGTIRGRRMSGLESLLTCVGEFVLPKDAIKPIERKEYEEEEAND